MLSKLKRYLALPLHEQMYFAGLLWYRVKGVVLYRRAFASFGAGSAIYPAAMIRGAARIHIGRNVTIRRGVRLEAATTDPAHPAEIFIGDNVSLEQNVHISAQGVVVLADNVAIGANSAIICGSHPFWDVHDTSKIGNRPGDANSRVELGEGTMLGIGVIIQNNVKLGRRCVVGSGAVVKKSAGDFAILEGSPAVTILQYDPAEERWVTMRQREKARAGALATA